MAGIEYVGAAAALGLAFANGANDNFKGVATLYGSGTLSYRAALAWGTVSTLLGSLASLMLASGLAARFGGKGLVPDAVAANPAFLAAVAGGATATVLLAASRGMPVSTTHALTGGLLGAGLVACGPDLDLGVLGRGFVAPLLCSPILAGLLVVAVHAGLAAVRGPGGREAPSAPPAIATEGAGTARPGIRAPSLLDGMHLLSAGAVGFARGLNDTPKLLGLVLVAPGADPRGYLLGLSTAMALGGLAGSRRIAETLGRDVTSMDQGQGFTANGITALLVGFASRISLPVSTTHVSSGALFGLGAITGGGRRDTIMRIVGAWVLTLPAAATAAALLYLLATR